MNFSSFLNIFANARTKSVEITLILLFLIWTPLLINSTLKIQHSCYPLIQVSQLPDICYNPPLITDKDGTSSTTNDNGKVTGLSNNTNGDKITPEKKSLIDIAKENPELVAGTAAIIVGAGLAIAGAPLLLVAGIGAGSYFVIKSIVEHLN
ncbi:hypothetical protein [Geminocystis sp.]|uniref:hypothetical protein n=1 Tax=Geminocystis sp. TaxID=2664100 RepID=UPI0035947F15